MSGMCGTRCKWLIFIFLDGELWWITGARTEAGIEMATREARKQPEHFTIEVIKTSDILEWNRREMDALEVHVGMQEKRAKV